MTHINVTIRPIGKSADDLRFFIYEGNAHAGGITVHSISGESFSYGIAVAREKRKRGIAKAALPLLYDFMKRRGFSRAVITIAPDNAASIALHRSLGFEESGRDVQTVTMEKSL